MLSSAILVAASIVAAGVDDIPDPLPQEIVQELGYFVGEWSLEGHGAMGPMKSSWTMRWAPGKHCLIVEYVRQEPDKVVLGNGLWSWDSASDELVYHAVYSDRGLEHIRSKVEKVGLFKGRYTGSLRGKKVEGTCELRKEGPNAWTFKTNGVAAFGLEELDVRFTRVTSTDAKGASTVNDAVPPEEVKKHFNWLVGEWRIEGHVGEGRFLAECEYRSVPGDHGLITHWEGGFGATPVHGTAVLGWDAKAQQVADFGFIRELGWRTTRSTPKASGMWEAETSGFIQGRHLEATSKVEIKGENEFVITSERNETSPQQLYRFRRVVAPVTTPEK